MSVHGMQPKFTDYVGYSEWRSEWRELYAHASAEVRKSKNLIKHFTRLMQQREDGVDRDRACDNIGLLIVEHGHKRAVARKLMTALETAKIRWQQIKEMKAGIKAQAAEFPLEIEGRNMDFHFNKKSMEFDFIPMWVVKARGKTYYVNHLDCQTGFSTRETPDHPSTKGSLRVKRGTLKIDAEGNAVIA
jgi:hypothetical protein